MPLRLPVADPRLQKKQKPSPHKFREGFGSLPGNPEFSRYPPRPGFSRSLVHDCLASYQMPSRISTGFLGKPLDSRRIVAIQFPCGTRGSLIPNISPPSSQRAQREPGSGDPASDQGRKSSGLLRRGDSGTPGISGSFFACFACFAVKLHFSGSFTDGESDDPRVVLDRRAPAPRMDGPDMLVS